MRYWEIGFGFGRRRVKDGRGWRYLVCKGSVTE